MIQLTEEERYRKDFEDIAVFTYGKFGEKVYSESLWKGYLAGRIEAKEEIKELKAEVEELKKNWRDDVKLSDNAKSQMWIEFEKENGKLRDLMKEAIKMIDRYPNEKDCACTRCIWLAKAKELTGG